MSNFIHLHTHSRFSIKQSIATVQSLVDKAIALGMPGIALTDNGSLMGAMELNLYCKEINRRTGSHFKPIIGCELNILKPGSSYQTFNIILLAKNRIGYENLLKIVNNSWQGNDRTTFITSPVVIEEHRHGLIVLSGGITGSIQDRILRGRIKEANDTIQYYKNVFGEDFYLEIQRHPTTELGNTEFEEQELKTNGILQQLAEENGVKIVATNNCYFAENKDAKAADAYAVILNKKQGDSSFTRQEWLKSQEEMATLFEDLPEAIHNTMEIFEQCEFYDLSAPVQVPAFPLPEGFDFPEDYLHDLAFQKAQTKYGTPLPSEVGERLDHELQTICARGCSDYFLILEDLIRHMREESHLLVGPGRGSSPCSLLCYCLGITQIDPMAFNLPFERFFHKRNPNWPDIDLDVEDGGHEEMQSYLENKYGDKHIAQTISFQTMSPHTIEQIMERFALPTESAKDLGKAYLNLGPSACGIAISKHITDESIPTISIKNWTIAQYNEFDLQNAGMAKLDVLDFNTLTKMHKIVEAIHQNKKISLDIDAISLEDEPTLQAFGDGKTEHIYAFNRDSTRLLLLALPELTFDTLVTIWSFYNYGAQPYMFASRKETPKITFHKGSPIDIIYRRQCGECHTDIFQEEIMEKARLIAGFSGEDCDIFRKALCRNAAQPLATFKNQFILGGISNGYEPEKLEEIWNGWYEHRTHHFCKSHAVCYALIGYRMMYLKVHFPEEFEAVMKE